MQRCLRTVFIGTDAEVHQVRPGITAPPCVICPHGFISEESHRPGAWHGPAALSAPPPRPDHGSQSGPLSSRGGGHTRARCGLGAVCGSGCGMPDQQEHPTLIPPPRGDRDAEIAAAMPRIYPLRTGFAVRADRILAVTHRLRTVWQVPEICRQLTQPRRSGRPRAGSTRRNACRPTGGEHQGRCRPPRQPRSRRPGAVRRSGMGKQPRDKDFGCNDGDHRPPPKQDALQASANEGTGRLPGLHVAYPVMSEEIPSVSRYYSYNPPFFPHPWHALPSGMT